MANPRGHSHADASCTPAIGTQLRRRKHPSLIRLIDSHSHENISQTEGLFWPITLPASAVCKEGAHRVPT
jgi:hypothetical protein